MAGRQAQRGFTLIELLVVVAIIAVLIALMMPTLGKARAQAAAAACGSNQRSIGLAYSMYNSENEQYMVPFQYTWTGGWGQWAGYPNNRGNYYWYTYLFPYTNKFGVFNCPVMNKSTSCWAWSPVRQGYETMVVDRPGQDGTFYWTYPGGSNVGQCSNYAYAAYNGWLEKNSTSSPWLNNSRVANLLAQYQRTAPQVGTPFILMDGVERVVGTGAETSGNPFVTGAKWMYVHPGATANVLFYDGHVDRRQTQDFKSAYVGYKNYLGTN